MCGPSVHRELVVLRVRITEVKRVIRDDGGIWQPDAHNS
jgi:hypothetical protein